MLIEGSKVLAATRDSVWQALNDPAFLQKAIPGCRHVTPRSDTELDVGLTAAVGPVKASFETRLHKLEVQPATSYMLKGEGSAGPAGAASGSVRVWLSDVEGGTLLRYSAETEVTGRVAQLGTRLIDSAARRFSEAFFANVGTLLAQPTAGEAAPARPQAPATGVAAAAGTPLSQGISALAWKLGLACAAGSFAGSFLAALLR